MKEALRAFLLADSGVAALVDTRITWAARPRSDALPSIALHLISGPREYSMGGPSGLVHSRVQVDCWATLNASATAVARAVRAAISGLRETVDGVEFQGVFIDNETDYTEEGVGADELLHRVSIDFLIWHSE